MDEKEYRQIDRLSTELDTLLYLMHNLLQNNETVDIGAVEYLSQKALNRSRRIRMHF